MSQLAIALLGSFDVTMNGASNLVFATDKARALLAYLVVESGESHRRETLATMFWPDRPEQVARNDLRQTLFHLRKALGDHQEAPQFLTIGIEQVQVNPAYDYDLDVADFIKYISDYQAHHADGSSLCEACRASLERAVDLYRGEFLKGFSLPGCLNFDLWQVCTQETLHIQALDALARLSEYYESRQSYDKVLAYSRRKIELEPWRESAYRRVMRVLARMGQTGQAMKQFEACRDVLRRELGIYPSPETLQLFEQIQNNRLEEAPDPDISVSEDELESGMLLDLLSRLPVPDEPEGHQAVKDSLCALALEIHKLRAGNILSTAQYHRLRKSLRDMILALEAVAYRSLVMLCFSFISEVVTPSYLISL